MYRYIGFSGQKMTKIAMDGAISSRQLVVRVAGVEG
jgi:hypothetical protein